MQPTTAISFTVAGFGLLGILLNKPRWVFFGSTIVAALTATSILERMFQITFGLDQLLGASGGRMSPVTGTCFLVLAVGFTWAQKASRN